MASFREQVATNVLTATRFRDLLKIARANRPTDDLEIIRRAYEFSLEHHTGQQRASGEPYLVHLLEVAILLAEMRLDTTAIAAGLLHDSVEDTILTTEEIKKEFGEQVAHIVEGVTKISKIDFASREEAQAENVRKMMWPWWTTSASCSSNWPTACTTCAPCSIFRPNARRKLPRRRWRFTLRSRTASAWARFAASSRISRFPLR